MSTNKEKFQPHRTESFRCARFAMMAGIELLEVGEGRSLARMPVTDSHLNGGDMLQRGASIALPDLAFAAAVNSHRVLTVSTSSNITFFRPVAKGSYVYAEATEIVDHRRMPYAEVRLSDDQGRLVAVFTSSGYRKEGVVIDVEEP